MTVMGCPSGDRRPGDATRAAGWRRRAATAAIGLAVAFAQPAFAQSTPKSFAELAEKLLPAVVNISTAQSVSGRSVPEMPQLPPGSPFEEFFKEFFERNQPRGEQRQRRATSLGSGFIIDPAGYVITNNHVIQDADEITVILQDNTRLQAELVGRDPKTDLAVLKVKPSKPLPAVSFGDSDKSRVGDWVIAIGNPFGLGGTVTAGIISARSRDINAGPYDDFLQTDASINRGNSGGPMFNVDGEVIGINTAIYSPSGGSIGIGFAIPAAAAKPVVRQLIEKGHVERGWLGVHIQTVTDEIAETLGLGDTAGALVASVIDSGPAATANIKAGDVILRFDGRRIDEMRRLPRVVAETPVGKTVDVTVWRDRAEIKLKVRVGELDEEPEKVAARASPTDGKQDKIAGLGFTVAELTPMLRERFKIADDVKGVVVTEIEDGGRAAEKDMRPGNVIVEIAQESVATAADAKRRIDEARKAGAKSVLLLVETERGRRFVALRLEG